jgi:hypothetical protein
MPEADVAFYFGNNGIIANGGAPLIDNTKVRKRAQH